MRVRSIALAFLGSFALVTPSGAEELDGPPNIVLVVADDLGYGDLGSYGQREIATPHLDRLAGEGMRFTNFYAGSTVCAPSRCVLMTGRHTGRCYLRGNSKRNLRPEDVTVAEVLKSAGYATGCFGKWGLGHEGSDGIPTRQGFDAFFGFLDQSHAHNYYPSFLVRDGSRVPLRNVVPNEGEWGQGVASEKVDWAPELMFDGAKEFLRAHAKERFFLYLPTTIPHANNQAGKVGMEEVPDLGRYADLDWPASRKGHAALISTMDAQVGELVAMLDELGIADGTLVLFTSDNGPHAEGGLDPELSDSNGGLRGIKRSLHDGGIRVPLIARWPGRVPAGSISDHVGSFADVLVTCAELAGVEPGVEHDGLSFVPTLVEGGRGQARHPYLYWEFYEQGTRQAVRFGRWKAIREPMHSGPIRLYDLATDLGESRDVAEDHPALVERARACLGDGHRPSEHW